MNPKPRRIPKPQQRRVEEDMTLCIAASVRPDEPNTEAIVCCFDFRIETASAGSETGYKFRKLGSEWFAMLAGSTSKSDRLLDLFVEAFSGKDISGPNVVPEIRRVVSAFRRELVEEYMQSVLSMSYQEFLDNKEKISASIFENIFNQLVDIRHGCDLIIASIKHKWPFLYSIDSNGNTEQCRNFVAIGSGASNAEAWLHYRKQSSFESVERTVAAVFEAKKFAETAPGVGKQTRLMVIEEEKVFINVDVENDGTESDPWHLYGPRELPTDSEKILSVPVKQWMTADWSTVRM